jgi:ferrochelatase
MPLSNRTGVLLLNLGTPDNPRPGAVARYLRQFLTDPRVIELPSLLRSLLVNCIIIPTRSRKSAHAYQQIWQQDGSPLLINSQLICKQLAQELGANYLVQLGMRYGSPSIANALQVLQAANVQEIVVLPLFPQYSSAASGSALQETLQCIAKLKVIPKVRVVTEFYQDPRYIQALAQSIKPHITYDYDYLLMSYHGLPERQMLHSSCYRDQCLQTSNLLAAELGLPAAKWSLSFQSRLGRLPWIQPYTDEVLQQLSARGVRKLVICCPSFVADCLETLEEIGMRARTQWQQLGGTDLRLVPCLNADPVWITTLKNIITA